MRFNTLQDWLSWQEGLHPSMIDLGLERVSQVFRRLQPGARPPFTVVTVAGTNGKGSSIALLEAILRAAGYRVGSYTSPHLLRYNERIRINGNEATDEAICEAFQRIDTTREAISLTYFEFGTLAALDIFYRQPLDIVLLEVGLGGRLDAVNIIDADIALITAIGLDHTDWLGSDRETIAREKAGIIRRGRPVVCSDPDMPSNIQKQADEYHTRLYKLGRDFSHKQENGLWCWQSDGTRYCDLPSPALPGRHQLDNASGVLMVLSLLAAQFPVSEEHMRMGLQAVRVRGRYEQQGEHGQFILDVAHNLDSATALAGILGETDDGGQTHAVVGMLADKDIRGVLQVMLPQVDVWYCADLPVPRGAKAEQLATVLRQLDDGVEVHTFTNVDAAFQAASSACAGKGENRIIVFGSFYTVAEILTGSV